MFVKETEIENFGEQEVKASIVDLLWAANIGICIVDQGGTVSGNPTFAAWTCDPSSPDGEIQHAGLREAVLSIESSAKRPTVLDGSVKGMTEFPEIRARRVALPGYDVAIIAVGRPTSSYFRSHIGSCAKDLTEEAHVQLFRKFVSTLDCPALDTLAYACPVAVHQVSTDSSFARASEEQLCLIGYESDPEKFIGANIVSFFAAPEQFEEMRAFLQAPEGLQAYRSQMLHSDGRKIDVSIYSTYCDATRTGVLTRCFLFPNGGG